MEDYLHRISMYIGNLRRARIAIAIRTRPAVEQIGGRRWCEVHNETLYFRPVALILTTTGGKHSWDSRALQPRSRP